MNLSTIQPTNGVRCGVLLVLLFGLIGVFRPVGGFQYCEVAKAICHEPCSGQDGPSGCCGGDSGERGGSCCVTLRGAWEDIVAPAEVALAAPVLSLGLEPAVPAAAGGLPAPVLVVVALVLEPPPPRLGRALAFRGVWQV